jgi:predicted transcriptional regulator YdeE
METIYLDNDMIIMYIQAASFPDGLPEAYEKLHALLPFGEERKFMSVSRMDENHSIIYRAGAEALHENEAAEFGLPALEIKKGRYLSITIRNFMEDTSMIGQAFQTLMQDPRIDPEGYCVEWYFNDPDVRCMIRLMD